MYIIIFPSLILVITGRARRVVSGEAERCVLMDSLEILKDLVDRTFGHVQVFCRICAFDDPLTRFGIQGEEPLEEIAVEEPGRGAFLPSYDRSVPGRLRKKKKECKGDVYSSALSSTRE